MLINTDKTKVMFFTIRQKRCNLNDASLHLKCNNIDLKLTKGDKILGANIDENLIWDSHYKYIVKKVSSHLWFLFGFILYVPSTIFQLCRNGSSWV